ncbi:MAG: DNA-processing protein DprA [Desulfomonile sp.]|nr:DNA-processing protein DprA [Desulfomonile sp.]
MHDSTTYDWLALERVPGVGPLTMARLFDAFGSPGRALEASATEIRRRTGIREGLAHAIADFTPPADEIARDLELLSKLGVRVMTRWDADYPSLLREIYDPPALLFVRGKIALENEIAVAIVGTRDPSRYGIEMTERLTRDLVRAGVTPVSGLARGIDTTCHSTALKENGRTIGVLGCGIDVAYPRENRGLIEKMADSGAVITEFRPGTRPLATNFFRRNRIVSGLAKGVVVVEAAHKSGSLITAGHALEQNREVFAVPGNVMNIRSRGPHKLIREGASLVESAEDILRELPPAVESEVKPTPVQPTLFPTDEQVQELEDDACEVLGRLDLDPVPIDDLCQALTMDVGRLSGILLELELKGLVRQRPGKMFCRA